VVGIKRYYGENRLRDQAIAQYLNNEEKNQEKKTINFYSRRAYGVFQSSGSWN
jgi:hypothetical protein